MSFLVAILWPGGTVMLSLKRWFSVSFSPPYNPSQSPDYSDSIHSVLGQVLHEPEFGFEHTESELTTIHPRENV